MTGLAPVTFLQRFLGFIGRRKRLSILCLIPVGVACLVLTRRVSSLGGEGVPALLILMKQWTRAANQADHVHDEAGELSAETRLKCNEYLARMFEESDVDVHVLLARSTSGLPMEDFASKKFEEMEIGIKSHGGRGILLLYDSSERLLRMEVGYALEAYLPDAFVGYLTRDYIQTFAESGRIGLGLRLGLPILQHRIRMAVLGNQFDPRVLEVLPKPQHLSGGAGASAAAGTGKGTKRIQTAIDNETRRTFEAGSSVRETYQRYLNWLSAGRFDPNIGIFTKESRNYLAGFPMSQGYFEYILFMQYGYAFKIEQRDELALMTYTDTPFACPHFFRRTDEGWQMDIVAEVRLAPDVIGGIYTWYLRMADDPFIDRFADKLIHIKGYNRLIDGDNRPLPIRNPAPRLLADG